MTIGLVGRKVGMTRIFTDDGNTLPVTVLDVSDNRITQIKTPEKDGYAAVQVAFGKRRANRVSKPLAGHLAKAAVEAGRLLKEFRTDAKALAELKVGGKLGVELFKVGQKVDVQGVTIGKGFSGVIKRHHFSSNRATHGNSVTTKAMIVASGVSYRRLTADWRATGPTKKVGAGATQGRASSRPSKRQAARQTR